MNWTHTPFTARLGVRLPIVQGPFGGGLSSVALVREVARAGGLGSFGLHHLWPDQIAQTAAALHEAAPGPFALNLWVPLPGQPEIPPVSEGAWHAALERLAPMFGELKLQQPSKPDPGQVWPCFEAQCEAVLAARPAVLSFVFGVLPGWALDRCRSLGITTIGAATTPREARLLEDAGVDMVVATGSDAGGHRVAFAEAPERHLLGTMSLIPEVRDAVRIPVIAAGGIADGRGVAAAMKLGADAVQIGTAFLACEESNAGDPHRHALFDKRQPPTALTRAFSGRLARGLRNPLMEWVEGEPSAILPYPYQNWLTGVLKKAAMAAGRADLMSLWSGQAVGLLRHHRAGDLLAELERESGRLLD
jgi:nitronate monooxygenase